MLTASVLAQAVFPVESIAVVLALHLADGAGVVAATVMLERRDAYSRAALLQPSGQASIIFFVLLRAAMAVGLATLLFTYPINLDEVLVRPIVWLALSAIMVGGWRGALSMRLRLHARNGRLSTKVAVIGEAGRCATFVRTAAADASLDIIGVYSLDGVPTLATDAQKRAVDVIVIALPSRASVQIAATRARLAAIAADIVVVADAALAATADCEFTMLGGTPVIAVAGRPLKDWAQFKKTLFDRVGAAVLLMLLLPLMTVIAMLIRVDSPGPAFFYQVREGLNGSSFVMLKFRTMMHRQASDEWRQASRGDRRITRVGRWLRNYSLDELPQLLNVLRGDMSLVGPRPHLATTRAGGLLLRDIVPGYAARHRVKPGLTGWAQVNGLRGETRTAQQVVDRVAYDLHYIDNWSVVLDMRIVAGTLLREVFSRSGNAY